MVSVRNRDDVAAAVTGGAQLLDFEFPSNQEAGRTRISTLAGLVSQAVELDSRTGCSCNLGDLLEFAPLPDQLYLPAEIRWLRWSFGDCRSLADWKSLWQLRREEVEQLHGRKFRWLAVACADHDAVNAPSPGEVLQVALQTACAGIVLETSSDRSRLVDCMSPVALCDFVLRARESCLPVFIAGDVTAADADWLCALEPDVILTRSASQRPAGNRLAIDGRRVRDFQDSLQAAMAEMA